MKLQRLFVLAAGLVLCIGVSQAAEIAGGTKELMGSFSFTDTDDQGKDIDLEAALGFFLTPHHEVGPIVLYFKEDPDVGPSFDDTGFGGLYRFNFAIDNEVWEPFAGAQAIWYGGDFGDFYDYSFGVEVGTRVMAGKRGAINLAAFWNSLTGADVTPDVDSVGISAGLSIFFGNE